MNAFYSIIISIQSVKKLTGFSPDCIWEIEGSWKEMQCEQGCHDTLYPLFPLIPEMAASEKNMKIPSELVPRCPKCGGTMIGHSPQRHRTAADREIQRRFQNSEILERLKEAAEERNEGWRK